jgi:Cu-Zn family superoxide dismutase
VCKSTGDHWNPTGNEHGNLNSPSSHAGDLGNIKPENGRVVTTLESKQLQLSGPLSIVGRSIVLHEKKDDLGQGSNELSLMTGNSGSRIACGTIGLLNVDAASVDKRFSMKN